jgi:hypothetical protein
MPFSRKRDLGGSIGSGNAHDRESLFANKVEAERAVLQGKKRWLEFARLQEFAPNRAAYVVESEWYPIHDEARYN